MNLITFAFGIITMLFLIACGSRTEPEIRAESYEPHAPPAPGEPSIAWVSEGGVPWYNQAQWHANGVGNMVADTVEQTSLKVPLTPPQGSLLECVRVAWRGAQGHGADPAYYPALSVFRDNLDNGSSDVLGQVLDEPGVEQYETLHQIQVCGFNEKVNLALYRYHVTLDSEWGEGALPGSMFVGVRRGMVQ